MLYERLFVRYYFLRPGDHTRAKTAEIKSPAIEVSGDRGIVGVREATGVTGCARVGDAVRVAFSFSDEVRLAFPGSTTVSVVMIVFFRAGLLAVAT